MKKAFKEMVLVIDTPDSLTESKLKVVWEDIGEGVCGDYNPADKDDVALLRFSCDRKVGRRWEGIDDASYCTRMPVNTPRSILKRALKVIMKELADGLKNGTKKRAMEAMSWLCPDDFKKRS